MGVFPSSRRSRCLCGIHVHNGTIVAVIVACIFYLLSLFKVVMEAINHSDPLKSQVAVWKEDGQWEHQTAEEFLKKDPDMLELLTRADRTIFWQAVFKAVVNAVALLAAGLMLVGLRMKRPSLYWPFLILVACSLVYGVIMIVATSIGLIHLLVAGASLHSTWLVFASIFFFAVYVFISFYFFFLIPKRSQNVLNGVPMDD
ncbi:hypothetical protein M3Y99_01391300 [Aphelenchoides fujianensis]|nr:hypothetical protein M3Y99_01391300 [Aphelenchoides fujianensis]